jgi:hypothetical protein
MPILEARINIYGGQEPCTICHRSGKRRLGLTEIYSEGTEDWVCAALLYPPVNPTIRLSIPDNA